MSFMKISLFIVNGLQTYFLAILMCKLQELKYRFSISCLGVVIGHSMMYFAMDRFVTGTGSKVFMGIAGFVIIGLVLFAGSRKKRILLSLMAYVTMVVLDFVVFVSMSPWIQLEEGVGYSNIQLTAHLMLLRNVYNIAFYLLYVLVEMLEGWKKGSIWKKIPAFSMIFAVCQIWNIVLLYQCSEDEVYIFVVSVFCSSVIMLGYHITMGMFYKVVEVQEKERQLEQKAMERQYQYDYYLLAKEQGEKIRDIRHDMRNQLQTMQCLIHSEKEEDRERARAMLSGLQEKLEGKVQF